MSGERERREPSMPGESLAPGCTRLPLTAHPAPPLNNPDRTSCPSLPVGSPAPDFTLASTSGSDVTLSSLRGKKVLLAFFPLAFTSTCTAELCAFSEDYTQFQAADTVVLPISVDSVADAQGVQGQGKDDGRAAERFQARRLPGLRHAAGRHFYSSRSYVVIDREGIIRWTFTETTPGTKRENAELLAQLTSLS